MTVIVAFLVGSLVMTVGFLMGALLSAARVADLTREVSELRQVLHAEMDPEAMVAEFRDEIDEFRYDEDDDY